MPTSGSASRIGQYLARGRHERGSRDAHRTDRRRGRPSTGSSSRPSGPRPTGSPASGTPARSRGDPLVAMALAGRATTTIELGTAVLQTYTCHPVLQANRAAAVVAAMGRPAGSRSASARRTSRSIEGMLRHVRTTRRGATPRSTSRILAPLLRGEQVSVDGRGLPRSSAGPPALVDGAEIPVLRVGAGAPAAAGRRRADRRHDPLDGQRPGRRDARRAPHPQGRGRRRPARAAHRRRPARSPCTTTSPRPASAAAAAVRRRTARCRTTGASSTSAARPGRPTPRSSATRPAVDRADRGAVRRRRHRRVGGAVPRRRRPRRRLGPRTRALLKELANG